MYVSQISTYEMGTDDHKVVSSIQQLIGVGGWRRKGNVKEYDMTYTTFKILKC